MLIYEYKLHGNKAQYAAIDEAIRVTQFIRNKASRLWMDTRGVSNNDLQCYCAVLAREFPLALRGYKTLLDRLPLLVLGSRG